MGNKAPYALTLPPEFTGRLETVNLEGLKFDPAYQRCTKSHHKTIADGFVSDAAGTLTVARRANGDDYTVDGRQRIEAMKKRGVKTWLANVFDSQGTEHEARIFTLINGPEGRRGLSWPELFKSYLEAKNPYATAVVDAIRQAGMELHQGKKVDWPHISCTGLLYRAVACGDLGHVQTTLRIVAQCWAGLPQATSHLSIGGVLQLLSWHGTRVDVERLIGVLHVVSPTRLIQEAGSNLSKNRSSSMMAVIVARYNKRLSQAKRLSVTVEEEYARRRAEKEAKPKE